MKHMLEVLDADKRRALESRLEHKVEPRPWLAGSAGPPF